jgi:1-acyl-sn-glycerol-3-phosphate acyltransferase
MLRVALVVAWIVLSLFLVLFIFPFLSASARSACNRRWSCALMYICGVKIRVFGQPKREGAALWVANHVSWIDIFVLNMVRPTVFIAKSEIRRWPVIGWLVAGSGTLFIERGHRHAVRAVGHQMKSRFDQGEVIGLFPEGTTSPGLDVAHFHSSLFEAAIRAHVDIQPVALRFLLHEERSDRVAFVGDQNLVQNLWRLLGTTGVVVEVEFLPLMTSQYCEEQGRGKVAERAYHLIRNAVVPAADLCP